MEYNKSSNQNRSKCITESTHISPSLHFTGGRCLLLLLSLVAAPVAGRSWPAGAAGPHVQQGGCSSRAKQQQGGQGRPGAAAWRAPAAGGREDRPAPRSGWSRGMRGLALRCVWEERGWKGKSGAFQDKRGWSRVSKRRGGEDFSAIAVQISRVIIEVFGRIIWLFRLKSELSGPKQGLSVVNL